MTSLTGHFAHKQSMKSAETLLKMPEADKSGETSGKRNTNEKKGMMENECIEVNKMPESDSTKLIKHKVTAVHALGLQDLYKAAFSQESGCNLEDKPIILNTNLKDEAAEKFFDNNEKTDVNMEKHGLIYKSLNCDETYQLLTLKGLQYADFMKPEENSVDLNSLGYETCKTEENLSSNVSQKPFEAFQNDLNFMLDLDKGIQIHLIKPDGTPLEVSSTHSSSSIIYNLENFEYAGDAQILHRYLCYSSNILNDNSNISNFSVGNNTLNLINKQNNNMQVESIYDNDSIGISPETLGVRFEDCDFNSSDSFASTESIIPKNIKCPKCPKKFMFKSDLLRHDKYKHSVKPKLYCKYCSKEFISQQNLFFHEKSHKKRKNIYKCEICKKIFKKSALLVKHLLNKHSKSNPFCCSLCKKIFTSQTLLNNHFKKFHLPESEKPFKCKFCSKSFEKKKGLSCHAKAHLEGQSLVCRYCNKCFTKFCYLKNHERSHLTEEKNSFVCDKCGKDFKTPNALEEHCRKHTGEKPFTCNVCMKRFAYKAYFKVHIKKHAEIKRYSCGLCSKTFISLTDLNKHEKSHGKDKPYRCITCNQNFSQESNLRNHWKKRKCNVNKYQEVCTQTTDFNSTTTLQNVNVIVNHTVLTNHP